jgi:branched-chain amino acid transport system ATP-binding protein
VLRVRNLSAWYGQALALKGITLHVDQGEIVALIGGNGAGKSTLLSSLAGAHPSRSGEIVFEGQPISSLSAETVVARGLSLVPEGRQIFAPLSVLDNLLLGGFLRYRGRGRRLFDSDLGQIWEIFPVLEERRHQLAGTLSGGEQQMLAIARSLMARPRLLLLDEPSLGLAPRKVAEIFRVIAALAEKGTTILLVEQNARAAFAIASRAYLLETGRIVMEGSIPYFTGNPEVQRSYLGRGYKEIWE